MMLISETEMYDDFILGRFVPPDKFGFIRDLYLMIVNADFTNCLFTSNHASSYLPIRAHLPHEKGKNAQYHRFRSKSERFAFAETGIFTRIVMKEPIFAHQEN